jgi:hypothetical protein
MAKNVNYYRQLFDGLKDQAQYQRDKDKDERDALAAETLNKKTMNDILMQNAANDRNNELFLSQARARALAGDQAGFAAEDIFAGRDAAVAARDYNNAYTTATSGQKLSTLPQDVAATAEISRVAREGALVKAGTDNSLNRMTAAAPGLDPRTQGEIARYRAMNLTDAEILAFVDPVQAANIARSINATPGAGGIAAQASPVQAVATNVANATAFATKTADRDAEQANKLEIVKAGTQGRIDTDTAKVAAKTASTAKPTATQVTAGVTHDVTNVRNPTVPAQAAPAVVPAPTTVAAAPAPVAPAVTPVKPTTPGQIDPTTEQGVIAIRREMAALESQVPAYNGRNPALRNAWMATPAGQRYILLQNSIPTWAASGIERLNRGF